MRVMSRRNRERACPASRARTRGPRAPHGERVSEKSRSVLCQGSSVSDKFEFIDAEYAAISSANDIQAPSIVKMCAWLEVSRSGFYEWRDRPTSMTARRREELTRYVQKSFDDSDGTYGYRRVHADLADWSIACGPELVRSIMRELG